MQRLCCQGKGESTFQHIYGGWGLNFQSSFQRKTLSTIWASHRVLHQRFTRHKKWIRLPDQYLKAIKFIQQLVQQISKGKHISYNLAAVPKSLTTPDIHVADWVSLSSFSQHVMTFGHLDYQLAQSHVLSGYGLFLSHPRRLCFSAGGVL